MGLTLAITRPQGALRLAGSLQVPALVNGNVIQRLEVLIHPPTTAAMSIFGYWRHISTRQDGAFICSGRL